MGRGSRRDRLRGYELAESGDVAGKGEIVTAIAEAGLRIESLTEHPFLEWEAPSW